MFKEEIAVQLDYTMHTADVLVTDLHHKSLLKVSYLTVRTQGLLEMVSAKELVETCIMTLADFDRCICRDLDSSGFNCHGSLMTTFFFICSWSKTSL